MVLYIYIYIYIYVCITLYDMVCIWDRFVSESWMGGHIKNSFTGLGMAKCAWIAHLTLFHQVCKTIRNQATGSSNHKVWKIRNKGICLFCETSQFSYWGFSRWQDVMNLPKSVQMPERKGLHDYLPQELTCPQKGTILKGNFILPTINFWAIFSFSAGYSLCFCGQTIHTLSPFHQDTVNHDLCWTIQYHPNSTRLSMLLSINSTLIPWLSHLFEESSHQNMASSSHPSPAVIDIYVYIYMWTNLYLKKQVLFSMYLGKFLQFLDLN